MSKKQKARSEKGRERAVELSGRLEEKVKGREERKVCSFGSIFGFWGPFWRIGLLLGDLGRGAGGKWRMG